MTEIELSIKIEGREVFNTNGYDWLMCGDDDRAMVLSALSESMVMICGTMPKPSDPEVSFYRKNAAPVLKMVPREYAAPTDPPVPPSHT